MRWRANPIIFFGVSYILCLEECTSFLEDLKKNVFGSCLRTLAVIFVLEFSISVKRKRKPFECVICPEVTLCGGQVDKIHELTEHFLNSIVDASQICIRKE